MYAFEAELYVLNVCIQFWSVYTVVLCVYFCIYLFIHYLPCQILLTKPDVQNETSRENLKETMNELLRLSIIPIVNANDVVADPPESDIDLSGVSFSVSPYCTSLHHLLNCGNSSFIRNLTDNDNLAMMILTDKESIY